MNDRIEVKVKFLNDPFHAWEERPVVLILNEENELNTICWGPEVMEIRWNFEDSYQGHYLAAYNT